jgi:hypothetical protein
MKVQRDYVSRSGSASSSGAETHRQAALRHVEAAARWRDLGDEERAALEDRNIQIEHEAAQ